jgi:hypothetical protein
VLERIGAMTSNLLLVRPGTPSQRGFHSTAPRVAANVDAAGALPNVLAAVPEQTSTATLRVGTSDVSNSVKGQRFLRIGIRMVTGALGAEHPAAVPDRGGSGLGPRRGSAWGAD